MERLLSFCIGVIISVSTFAQYAQEPLSGTDQVILTSKGGRIFMNDQKLHDDVAPTYFTGMNGTDRSKEFVGYRSRYRAGIGLTAAGAGLTVLGTGTFLLSGIVLVFLSPFPDAGDNAAKIRKAEAVVWTGAGSAIAGVGMMAAGIPTMCVYKKRIRSMVTEYNARSFTKSDQNSGTAVEVSFGSQPSGIGFALKF